MIIEKMANKNKQHQLGGPTATRRRRRRGGPAHLGGAHDERDIIGTADVSQWAPCAAVILLVCLAT